MKYTRYIWLTSTSVAVLLIVIVAVFCCLKNELNCNLNTEFYTSLGDLKSLSSNRLLIFQLDFTLITL